MDDKGCPSRHFLFVFSLGKLLIYGLSSRIRTATADRSADFENWLKNEWKLSRTQLKLPMAVRVIS